jgi:hypothetical protein
MNKKSKYHSRKFLNKGEGMAAIEVSASLESWMFECQVALSDCNRQVCIDLSIYTAKDIKPKLDKLDLMINELTKLKLFMDSNKDNYLTTINARNKRLKNKNLEQIIEDLND